MQNYWQLLGGNSFPLLIKVVKILQELAESKSKANPKHQRERQTNTSKVNKQQNYRWKAEKAALSPTGGNSVTFAELNELDTQKS